MLKVLQVRLQQYVNRKLPDVQAGFRKGRETRDQIDNICWIIKKAREFQKNIYFCFIYYAKAFDFVNHKNCGKFFKNGTSRPPDLSPEKSVCRSGSNSQNWTWNNRLVPNRKRSRVKAVYCHPAYLTYMQSEVAQLCPTLCDPMDCSPPGFSIHGIFQA